MYLYRTRIKYVECFCQVALAQNSTVDDFWLSNLSKEGILFLLTCLRNRGHSETRIDEKKKGDLETTMKNNDFGGQHISGHIPEIYSSIISEGRDWVLDCPATHRLAHLGKTRLYNDIHTVSI